MVQTKNNAQAGLVPTVTSVAQMDSVYRKTGNVTTTGTVLMEKMNNKDVLRQRAKRTNSPAGPTPGIPLTVFPATGGATSLPIVPMVPTRKPAIIGLVIQTTFGATVQTYAYQKKRNVTAFSIVETIAT
ncbi:hypothetical protein RvY_05744-2 [Ramazzottius varieornatus]|uniref:Uncharacterized protein n=1 Tax=Ramazzottius varieornatus TaxID=947166 RepID=A0A1D1V2R3_RAMVA|nr:hypothetical protein RvY_05744-2 [Ramazzottius varieornatus]